MSTIAPSNKDVDTSEGAKGGKNKQLTPWRQPKNKVVERHAGISGKEARMGYLFVSPFFVMFLIFGIAPIAYTTYIAFFNYDPLGEQTFIGMQNFTDLWADSRFWIALRNTFSIWIFSTFPMLFMAIGLASVLRTPNLKFKIFWRTILLMPNITSVLAVAIVFGQLFGREFGMINFLGSFLGLEKIDFITETIPSHIAIATMITWRWVGYNALIFLAAMLAIPNELYESAGLDGASKWQQFRYVTLPQLRNTITFVLIVGTIGGLQVFAEPLTLGGDFAGGDSRQFSTLTLFLFEQAFVEFKFGYAAAIGIAITFIVIIISAINFALTRRIASEDSK
jgi:cellobiose transport system permease protein